MPIQFACPNPQCQNSLSVSDEYAGQKVRCPTCRSIVKVPRGSDERSEIEQIGAYRIVRRLGGGGMGAVYEAIQEKLDRRVAIKVLSREMKNNPLALARFQREARAAGALNHPHIIQVYDIADEGGLYYFSMEFIDGETVMERLKREGKLSIADSLSIAEAVAKALHYAHERSFIHRDIKPENIMIDREGRIKLADLGLAKNTQEGNDVTVPGTGLGTPYYMAPEQSTDAASVDHRADIYALGVTLMHIMTGRRPFDGKSAMRIIRAHLEQPLPSGRDLGTELPQQVDSLLQKMCAKDRDQRYTDYNGLLADLGQIKESLSPAKPAAVAEETQVEKKLPGAAGAATRELAGAALRSEEKAAVGEKATTARARGRARRRRERDEGKGFLYLILGVLLLIGMLILWRIASKR